MSRHPLHAGVAVEYMEESDAKAWVRFRYPRWMYDGPAICGMPIEASRGGFARNGVRGARSGTRETACR